MDRVVQEAIKMVLEAIWEHYFEKMNRSFGFRSNKGTHDAIAALKSGNSNGLFMAIEGDIQQAYDKVAKDRLMKGLETKIADKIFI